MIYMVLRENQYAVLFQTKFRELPPEPAHSFDARLGHFQNGIQRL